MRLKPFIGTFGTSSEYDLAAYVADVDSMGLINKLNVYNQDTEVAALTDLIGSYDSTTQGGLPHVPGEGFQALTGAYMQSNYSPADGLGYRNQSVSFWVNNLVQEKMYIGNNDRTVDPFVYSNFWVNMIFIPGLDRFDLNASKGSFAGNGLNISGASGPSYGLELYGDKCHNIFVTYQFEDSNMSLYLNGRQIWSAQPITFTFDSVVDHYEFTRYFPDGSLPNDEPASDDTIAVIAYGDPMTLEEHILLYERTKKHIGLK